MKQVIVKDVARAAQQLAAVGGLAQIIAEVYAHADDDLRHTVRDTFQAGMPGSALNADLPATEAGLRMT